MPPKDDTKKTPAADEEATEIRALKRKGQPGMGATSGGPLGDRMVRGGEIVREDELPAEKFAALAKDPGFDLIKVAKVLLVALALAVMSLAPVTAVADGTHFTYDAKIGWGGAYLNTLPTVLGGIDTAFTGVKGAVHSPVADIAALKAIPATGATARADKQLCYVEAGPGGAKVLYAFDAQSSTAGDDDLVVAPTSGTGRWIKVFDATDGASYAVLASTDTGEGASLIGIFDTGNYFGAATDVEAALQLVGPTMTDARTPTAHAISHATGGGDELEPSDIGAATAADLDALEAKTAPYLLPVLAAWDPTDVGAGAVDPPTQVDGDRYLASATESPYVIGRIYEYDSGTSTWSWEAPDAGYVSYNVATTTAIVYDGTNWGPLGTSLPGLTATATELNAVADVSATGAVTKWVKCTMTDRTAGAHALGCTLPSSAYLLHDIVFVVATQESSGTTTVDVGTAGDGSLLVDALSVAAAGTRRPTITVTEGATETYVSAKDCGEGLCSVAAGSDVAGDTGLAVWHPYVNATPDALVYTVPAGGWTEWVGYALVQVTEIAP